ncbi:1035_t:CDS:1, partial [Diversispora eburnea]
RVSVKTLKTMYTNLLDLIPSELISSITKNLPIQDLKNCCSLDNIWKTEMIKEIRKRLIVDCTFIDSKTTIKALIDPKSQYNSISKALAKKMDLYISREYGSRYLAVIDCDIGATNAGKKVIRRGWIDREKVSVTLPNIFDDIVPPSYLGIDTAYFVVVDKPEYDLVLGSTWLMRLGDRIDEHDGKYWETNEEKRIYYARNNIDIVFLSLYTFYELLFPKFTTINSDGEVILIEFSDQNVENTSIDLSEYYDLEYSETESEFSDSKTESEFSDSETESEFSDFISVLRSFRDNSLNYRLA